MSQSSARSILALLFIAGLSSAQLTVFADPVEVVSTVYVVPRAEPTSAPPVCPGSYGTAYKGTSGATFVIECGIDHAGGDMGMTHADTLEECIMACDAEPTCVDVSLSGVACYLKSILGRTVVQPGIQGARRMTAASSSTASSAMPSATPGVECPKSNGTTLTTSTYARFEIGCGVEASGGDIGRVYVESFDECIDQCDQTDGCVAVSKSGNKSLPSPCYLKGSVGPMVSSPVVSFAHLTVRRPKCPSPAGTTYTALNGKQFVIECDTDHPGGDIASFALDSSNVNSRFGECIEKCSINDNCVDISLQSVGCYLKGGPLSTPSSAKGMLGARLLNATVKPTPPSATPMPTPKAVSPVDVGNFEYIACYNDSVGRRVLDSDVLFSTKDYPMTAEVCAEFCEDFTFFGLEYGLECYCADKLTNNPVQNAGACTTPCAGNTTQLCGGRNALSLYRSLNATTLPLPLNGTSTALPAPFPTSTGTPFNSTNSTGGDAGEGTRARFIRKQESAVTDSELAYEP